MDKTGQSWTSPSSCEHLARLVPHSPCAVQCEVGVVGVTAAGLVWSVTGSSQGRDLTQCHVGSMDGGSHGCYVQKGSEVTLESQL